MRGGIERNIGLPENVGRRGRVEIGGMSKKELQQQLKTKLGTRISRWAQGLLNSRAFKVAEQQEQVDLVAISVAELGLSDGATTQEIYEAAQQRGLELCPAEVGPALRLQADTEDSLGQNLVIAMKPITDSDGLPHVFYLRRGDGEPWLLAIFARPDRRWHAITVFVFRLRKEPSESQDSLESEKPRDLETWEL